ncbi:PP2C family protein-serine/threonine phosphatase [Amycolatopsis suaedae]|uniref:GAF domain-containing protein n=1 Tax=Amycolatopsis suaedae TaxID=2510978 RepID=A0A4Q7JCB6_9PSEU|nr:GAF domain-containing SpoIIE family protein phosphatase [Amycolatopsis suaedae]RZQ64662.1 GAF domain-containing protein [Amycolatopsis suaedae]
MSEPADRDERLRTLEAVTDSALGHLDLDTLLERLLNRLRDLLGVDTATVLQYEPSAEQLVAVAAAGLEEEVFQGVRVPVGAGFAGRVAALREPVTVDHVDSTTVVNPLLWEKGLKTLLGAPMLVGGDLIGVVHIGSLKQREFTAGDVELLELVAGRLALAMQAEATTAERAAASALQRSLLPGRLPSIDDMEFAARYVPGAKAAVGGDWYDLFPLPGDRLGIVIGDVAGHGLQAAVVMGRLRSALRAYALDGDDPGEVLGKLDRKAGHFEHGVMATVGYGVIDPAHDRLRLSLGGHLPPVLATTGGAELVPAEPDPPIGLWREPMPRHTTEVALPPDSVLAFYTDGLVERRHIPLDDGLERLRGALLVDRAETVCARAMSVMVGNAAPEDDVALIVARRLGVTAG